MSLSFGTLSQYKLYDAINAIIGGDYGRNKITINTGSHVNGETVTIDGLLYNVYTTIGVKGQTNPQIQYYADNDDSANAFCGALNWETGDPETTSDYIVDTENATVTCTSAATNPVIFRTKTKTTSTLTTSTSNATRYDLYSSSMVGGRAASSIIALLGDSTEYGPVKLDQSATFPALRYGVVADNSYETKDGPSDFIKYRVQFDCFASDHADCHELLAAVKSTFDRFSGLFYRFENGYILNIENVIKAGSERDHGYNQDLEIYHASVDYEFYIKETAV